MGNFYYKEPKNHLKRTIVGLLFLTLKYHIHIICLLYTLKIVRGRYHFNNDMPIEVWGPKIAVKSLFSTEVMII